MIPLYEGLIVITCYESLAVNVDGSIDNRKNPKDAPRWIDTHLNGM